ncbi:hypothetical protein F66182_11430, partial [Fusarium sp. NRRL 66182]
MLTKDWWIQSLNDERRSRVIRGNRATRELIAGFEDSVSHQHYTGGDPWAVQKLSGWMAMLDVSFSWYKTAFVLDFSSMAHSFQSFGTPAGSGYQETEPSAAEEPQARYSQPAARREAGIKIGPFCNSDTDDDTASDTDDDYHSREWEYTRIVGLRGDPHRPTLVMLRWADTVVLEKDLEKWSKALKKYNSRTIHFKDHRGCDLVAIRWADSWVPVENVTGLDGALA